MSRPSPFSVHVGELRRRLGNRRELHAEAPLPGLTVVDARVATGSDVVLDAMLESIPDGVVVTGAVTARWEGICRRCLDEVGGELTADVREIYESSPIEGETWPLAGDRIELEALVRETVLLSLPLAPLCSADCRGPAPDVFPAIAGDGMADGDGPDDLEVDGPMQRDPRWAALDALRQPD